MDARRAHRVVRARPQDALALSYAMVGKQRVVYAAKNGDGRILEGAKAGEDKGRSVGLLSHLRRDLLAYRTAATRSTPDYLVVALPDGSPWRLHDCKNWQRRAVAPQDKQRGRKAGMFAAAVAAIGRPNATPYFLRRTYASLRLAEQRLSLQEIATEMGHTVEVLASTYAHVISEYAGRGPIDPDALIAKARRPKNAPRQARDA